MINAIELTLALPCNNRCAYCPQYALEKSYGGIKEMAHEVLDSIIRKIPDTVDIHVGGFGEPFQNYHCMDWLEILNYEFPDVRLFTTFAGATMHDIERLADIQIPVVCHLPDGKYYRAKDSLDMEVILSSAGLEKIEYIVVSDNDNSIPYYTLALNKNIKLERIVSRSGLVSFANDEYIQGATRCKDNRQRQPVILPDGTMVICCNDYGMKHVIGNIVTDELGQIEDKIREFEADMADPEKETICNKCWRAM